MVQTKYTDGSGVAEIWANTKNYILAQLLGYSQTGHTHSASDITSGLATVATSGSYNDLSNKPTIPSKTSDLTNDSGFITSDNTKIPLAGSNQISGDLIPTTNETVNLGSSSNRYNTVYTFQVASNNYVRLDMCGGLSRASGGTLSVHGKDLPDSNFAGTFLLRATNGSAYADLLGKPNGTLTWGGQSIQTTSDQRLKQQIAQIDDDLLTAWEDVNLVQFKYNDAVEEKGNTARLHTGYVVQQIDSACKSHGVDISKYGLYCHEEYAEETREVEHEDGTKTTEVVRPANEHYSLRYTEALIVECAFLRKKLKELTARIEQLEKGNKEVEK